MSPPALRSAPGSTRSGRSQWDRTWTRRRARPPRCRRGHHRAGQRVGPAVWAERQRVKLHGARQILVELGDAGPRRLHHEVVGRKDERGGGWLGQQCGVEQQVRGERDIGVGCAQGHRLAAAQRRERVGLMWPERLAGERNPGLSQLGVDWQVRDPLAVRALKRHKCKQRGCVAAPTLPGNRLKNLADALHRSPPSEDRRLWPANAAIVAQACMCGNPRVVIARARATPVEPTQLARSAFGFGCKTTGIAHCCTFLCG